MTTDIYRPEPGVDYQTFIPGAEDQEDIHLTRGEMGARVSIPQHHIVHSPTGLEWGYLGSGPADLALNILALFVRPPEAWRLHQRYKEEVIAGIPREGGEISAESVRTWIEGQWTPGPHYDLRLLLEKVLRSHAQEKVDVIADAILASLDQEGFVIRRPDPETSADDPTP